MTKPLTPEQFEALKAWIIVAIFASNNDHPRNDQACDFAEQRARELLVEEDGE